MSDGWIKLWRKSLDTGWLKNPKLWTFWCWCLMKATHIEHDQIVGYQKIHLMPGEFIFGRKRASEELEMSEQIIRTNIDSLRKLKNLTIKTTNKFSIVSIVNWDTYQSLTPTNNQQTNQQLTNKQPTTNHKQERKNVKNVKNKDIVKGKFIKPAFNEISTYCLERKNSINPQTFLDHYDSNGWMVGKNKMKDWKATIRTWEQRNYVDTPKTKKIPKSVQGLYDLGKKWEREGKLDDEYIE